MKHRTPLVDGNEEETIKKQTSGEKEDEKEWKRWFKTLKTHHDAAAVAYEDNNDDDDNDDCDDVDEDDFFTPTRLKNFLLVASFCHLHCWQNELAAKHPNPTWLGWAELTNQPISNNKTFWKE